MDKRTLSNSVRGTACFSRIPGNSFRNALLASAALALMLPAAGPAPAQDATWLTNPGSGNFYDPVNWNPVSLPTGTATFGASSTTALTLGSSGTFGGWTLNAGASNYTFTISALTSQDFTGTGITINGGGAGIVNFGSLSFTNASTADSASITNGSVLNFHDSSSAGSATITNTATMAFTSASTAGSASISNSGNLIFHHNSTAGSATITNGGLLDFRDTSTAGSASIANSSNLRFFGASTAGSATITNTGDVAFFAASSAGNATIINSNNLFFDGTSTAGSATISNNGTVYFRDASTGSNATITNSGTLRFLDVSTGGNAAIINQAGGTVDISGVDTSMTAGSIAGAGDFILGSNRLIVGSNDLSTEVSGVISGAGGKLDKTGAGTLTLTGANTYTGGTTITSASSSSRSTLQLGTASRAGSILGSVSVGNWSTLAVVNADMSGTTIANTSGYVTFYNTSTAGSATITNDTFGSLSFNNASTAGSATIANDGGLVFVDASTAGSATIINNGNLQFEQNSTAGSATITNNNDIYFSGSSTAGGANITNNTNMVFYQNSSSGNATIVNNGSLYFHDTSTAGSATITNTGSLEFSGASTAGTAAITNNNDMFFVNASTAGTATITNNSSLAFGGTSTAGSATIANTGSLTFSGSSSAGSATITNGGAMLFSHLSNAGSANIINNGILDFVQGATAGNAALINDGIVNFTASTGPAGDRRLSAGSIAGTGSYILGANTLTVGSNNLSTTVSGVISGTGSLVKTGTGTLTLINTNTYTGATIVNAGSLVVNGSIASSNVTVNAGATLGGNGTIGVTTITSGGTLAPGNSIGTLNVTGNLTFGSGAFYRVEVSPSAADRTNVTGVATLTGATVQVVPLMGRFRSQTYTILNASGGLSGTFAGLTAIGSFSPGARNPHLTYDANNVFLVLDPGVIILPAGTNQNQTNVAAGINRVVESGGTPPVAFDALLNMSGAQLSTSLAQASGEVGANTGRSTFAAMNQFFNVLFDPSDSHTGSPGETAGLGASGGPLRSFTGLTPSASGGNALQDVSLSAHVAPLVPQWRTWATGYGASNTTAGNATVGSHGTSNRILGTAMGADYRLSPDTRLSVAFGIGSVSFSTSGGLGSGCTNLYQAGIHARHSFGSAYIAAGAAYGWQDVTTDRTVTIAGIDRLQGKFQPQTFAARGETGYRFATPWLGVTPYVAGQATSYYAPAYAERAISGGGAFALSYTAQTKTNLRTELGVRLDKSFRLAEGQLKLLSRLAWAQDTNTGASAAATFQSLPGSTFTVRGAQGAANSVLISAGTEMAWRNGFSIAGSFEGEFSARSRGYAGKGTLRYVW